MKIGDKVKCVRPDRQNFLKQDSVYTIDKIHSYGTYLCLVETEGCFFTNRFILVNDEQLCSCSSHQLLWGGCICGVFKASAS